MTKIAFLNRSLFMIEEIAKKLKEQGYQTILLNHCYTPVDQSAFDEIVYLPRLAKSAREYEISDEELLQSGVLQFEYLKKVKRRPVKQKQLTIVKKHMTVLHECLRSKDVDVVFLYNGSTIIEKITELVSKDLGLRTIYIEEGFFRPFTVSVDPKGVNAKASVPRDADFYCHLEIDNDLYNEYLLIPRTVSISDRNFESLFTKIARKITYGTWNKIMELTGEQIKTDYMVTLGYILHKLKQPILKQLRRPRNIELPNKYIFVPLQVHSDSQVLLHSPKISGMEEFIKLMIDSVTEFNNRYNENYSLVIKQHPQDYIQYSRFGRKYVDTSEYIILKDYNTQELICNAELIITINSTVAIEALTYGKKVISLGDAFYNIPGIVHHCDNHNKLPEMIKKVIEDIEFNEELIKRFLYYLRFEYNVEGFLNTRDIKTIHNIVNRIEDLIKTG